MIYLDNAATGGFKPRAVTDAAATVTKYLCANPGRSGHRLSLTGERCVFACREALADMFDGIPERTVFTKNCTEALNTAIFGTLKKGGHVITTVFEHNSVLRPLHYLAQQGYITLDIVSSDENKGIAREIESRIRPDTYLICMTSVSNVTGEEFPVSEVGRIASEHGIKYLVDGAQGGGHVPLSLTKQHISMLALPGHKGLYGIMGSGALLFDKNTDISPLTYGGTGTESYNLNQPSEYPERLEAGTVNLPAIAALTEGVRYIKSNINNFGAHLLSSTDRIINELSLLRHVSIYSHPNRSGIVSFTFDKIPSAEAADIFNSEYDIAVRGGLHCAPLTHRHLGTEEGGLIRASLSVQNSAREISYFIKAVREISEKQ